MQGSYEVSVFPQDGQKRSETTTGLPHFGQNPADFSLRSLRRAAIMDSISSSAEFRAGRDGCVGAARRRWPSDAGIGIDSVLSGCGAMQSSLS